MSNDKDRYTIMDLFDMQELHPKIIDVSRDLFRSGHFEQAIVEAFKSVENEVKEKSGKIDLFGQNLMAQVFNEKDPILQLTDMKTISEKDEQLGFKFIFMGVSIGIRNPRAHENLKGGQERITLEYLALASLLMRRVDAATLTMHADEIVRVVKQKTFVRKEAYISAILDKIPPQLHTSCAEKLIDVFLNADETQEVQENAYFVYRTIIQRFDSGQTKSIAQKISKLCDDDNTFAKGIRLLHDNQVQWLDTPIVEKIFGNLVSDLSQGSEYRDSVSDSVYLPEVIRLRQVLPKHYLEEICELIQKRLREGNWYTQAFATRILHGLRGAIPDGIIPGIMEGLIYALIYNRSYGARNQVEKQIKSYPEMWIKSFVEILLNEKGNDEDRLYWLNLALECSSIPDDLVAKIATATVKLTPSSEQGGLETPF